MESSRAGFAEALRQAHNGLLKDLRDLREMSQPPGETTQESPTGPALATLLEKARTDVLEHFSLEEEGGYLHEVLKLRPNLERTLQELQDEHRQMAEGLDALITEARSASTVSDPLLEKVRAWIKQLHTHEAHENTLVQDAFNVDIGAED